MPVKGRVMHEMITKAKGMQSSNMSTTLIKNMALHNAPSKAITLIPYI